MPPKVVPAAKISVEVAGVKSAAVIHTSDEPGMAKVKSAICIAISTNQSHHRSLYSLATLIKATAR